MANIFEIDKAIMECLDMETGEVLNEEALEALQMERSQKIENVALWIKNLDADVSAFKGEVKALQERQKSAQSKRDNLAKYITLAVGEGNVFETTKAKISWRKSEAVEVEDVALLPEDYVRIVTSKEADKSALKDALKNGEIIPGATLIERQNLNIK